jgi:hypothetical protein
MSDSEFTFGLSQTEQAATAKIFWTSWTTDKAVLGCSSMFLPEARELLYGCSRPPAAD